MCAAGTQAESLSIEQISYSKNEIVSPFIAGYLGAAYDFSIEGEFDSARITFEYDQNIGIIGDEFQPRIYYINTEDELLEELPDQEVINGRVSVTVTHFSTYILLNKIEFDKVWENDIKPPEYENENNVIELVFAIDYSASMDWNDPNVLRKEVSKEFVEKMNVISIKSRINESERPQNPSLFCYLCDSIRISIILPVRFFAVYLYVLFMLFRLL